MFACTRQAALCCLHARGGRLLRALSALVHTRFSWTFWSCLADRVQLLMLAGKLPCSLPLSVVVSQPCCLIAACLLEALKGISFFVIAMKGGPDWWETGKERRCGERRPFLLCFFYEYSNVSYFQVNFKGKVKAHQLLLAFGRELFYRSHVVVCLEIGWTEHARESIHYRFLAFSVLTLYSFAPPRNCSEQKIQ